MTPTADPSPFVLHVAAEAAPLAKVGGLGDVLGALPGALAGHGVRAAVAMPLYGGPGGPIAARAGDLREVHAGEIAFGSDRMRYWIRESRALAAPTFLVDLPDRFGDEGVYFRAADNLPHEHGETRFVAFQLAVLDALLAGAFGAPDVLHLHDHHTGLMPVLMACGSEYAALRGLPTVFTVHSAEHQGGIPWWVWDRLNVFVADADAILVEEEVNSMKAALRWATAVTTVSPSYAEELMTDDRLAHGLAESFRRARPKFSGLLNGIDAQVWNPATDPHLPARFSADDLAPDGTIPGKAATKAAVCADLGLDAGLPLVAFVGRLMPEKGVEILFEGAERVVRAGRAAVALLGTGYPEHEAEARGLQAMLDAEGLADRLSVSVAFDEGLAHRLYAAADVFLMPSRSEPCGLGQLYAMAYGAVPVVHATGGLRDTVRPWDGTAGTGVAFDAFTADALAAAVAQALDILADPDARARLLRAAMTADFSWDRSARAYADLYCTVRKV